MGWSEERDDNSAWVYLGKTLNGIPLTFCAAPTRLEPITECNRCNLAPKPYGRRKYCIRANVHSAPQSQMVAAGR